jgi:hypothetical protein
MKVHLYNFKTRRCVIPPYKWPYKPFITTICQHELLITDLYSFTWHTIFYKIYHSSHFPCYFHGPFFSAIFWSLNRICDRSYLICPADPFPIRLRVWYCLLKPVEKSNRNSDMKNSKLSLWFRKIFTSSFCPL